MINDLAAAAWKYETLLDIVKKNSRKTWVGLATVWNILVWLTQHLKEEWTEAEKRPAKASMDR